MPSRDSRRDRWWVDTGRQTFWATLQHPRRFWFGGDLDTLPPDKRDGLIAAQVEATRPAFSAIVGTGGLVLLLAGVLEAAGATTGIGYGAALTLAAACGVIAMAVALWRLQKWPTRLTLALVATAVTGVFLSVPLPGVPVDVHARVGLFNLIPIGLLALLVRPLATWLLVAVFLLVALLRVMMHGAPPGGPWLYWLYTVAIIAFGLLLRGYRTGFAVEAYRVRHQLWEQANTDALTGVFNRAGWNRMVVLHYHTAVEAGRPVSLAFFDVDHFKRINDTWGHERGDEVLQALGRVLHARQDDRVWAARMGGEEFVVLLVDTPPEAVERFCHRVCESFAEAIGGIGTLSAGIAHGVAGETLAQHLHRADAALYQAKHLGRDRVEVDASGRASVD
ncbi:GGDEF domain-containing protein [Aerolutibacter daejeonensis]|uniref:GGDEF domain-containing protein n=1 Tax=Aerolutibacter daejeonensis TaxID=346181 RepID=UPI0012EB7A66|nr:GGDEF domain-containing protein [Lysobacter daejeonensis]